MELEIPARLEFVALARLLVSSFAASTAVLPEDRIDDLKITVSEACTNAIEAYAGRDAVERVLVRCHAHHDRLEIDIEDRGEGFDPAALPDHPPVTDPDRLKFERGLGIPLIRALVDEVEFSSSGGGTAVRIVMWHSDSVGNGRVGG